MFRERQWDRFVRWNPPAEQGSSRPIRTHRIGGGKITETGPNLDLVGLIGQRRRDRGKLLLGRHWLGEGRQKLVEDTSSVKSVK